MSGRSLRTAAASEAAGTVVPSKSQRAYDLLHDRIVDGTYSPGYRLVLDAIGRELDMSVVPVREAIRRLEAEGMVTFERNIGARVAEIDELEYHDTMETLSFVEGAAISLAAGLYSQSDVADARSINEQMRQSLAQAAEEEWIAAQIDAGNPVDGLFPMNAEWRAKYEAETGQVRA